MALERTGRRLDGSVERFVGYGVTGLPFTLGDILAFRRITASSVGPGYTAVWHRDPTDRWTIYTTGPGAFGDVRYYGRSTTAVRVAEISLQWTGSYRLSVSVPEHHVEWALRLEPTGATRIFNAIAPLVPGRLATRLLSWAGETGVPLLKVGTLGFEGTTPSGHRFRVEPRRLWLAAASAATVDGRDLGPIGSHGRNAHLGERILPDRGLFVIGREVYSVPATAGVTGSRPAGDAPRSATSSSSPS